MTYSNIKAKKTSQPKPNKHKSGRPKGQTQRFAPRKKSQTTIDPNALVKKAVQVENTSNYLSDRFFKDLPISESLKATISKKGYERPSEIQDKTFEHLISGSNLLGIAQTGTGKTAAFLIPIIEQLIANKQRNHALILVPTRELATQIEDEFKSLASDLGLASACFIGGTNINRDLNAAKAVNHIVIATPGRLLDLVDRKAINLGLFKVLILDEFDRMLDMGFVHDVRRILNLMPNRKQSILLSATLDAKQETLINGILKEHVTVKVSSGEVSGDGIEQDIIKTKDLDEKFATLCEMVQREDFKKVLIFEETKHRANRLCERLNKIGVKTAAIHGNKSQNARQNALNDFKDGKIKVLVATDVAARGIDVSDITHVINYQIPQSMDSYIHRIGRTGRAGKVGKAYTFV